MEIQKIIENIESNQYEERQLVNLYNNANKKEGLSEEDKEAIISAIEKNTRLRFPRAAKRIFGAKESVAYTMLEKLYTSLRESIDFKGNKLKNGVKTGGYMISGEFYIDVYMSYKNIDNQAVSISLTQKTIEDELEVRVRRYSTYNEDSGTQSDAQSGIDLFDEYSEIYKKHLIELTN